MKQIFKYIHEYFLEEWNSRLFASTGIFLVICFVLNYGFDPERLILRQLTHPLQQLVFYFFFYAVPFGITLAIYIATTKRKEFLQQKHFYVLALFCFILLSIYVTLHNFPLFVLNNMRSALSSIPREYHWYFARYASNVLPGVVILIPLICYWLWQDRESSRLYGFSSSNITLKTYFSILLLIAPLVIAASFGGDFQSAYPRFKFGLPQTVAASERTVLVSAFEVCYGVDFVFVELLFRGFMVMAFSRYLKSGAILPMVVVYAFIHFQKPMGEAIGSIVGGLVLGIISHRTKSIYGGVIIHLGVAYFMEIADTLQVLFR